MREKRLYVECDRCHTAITVKQDLEGPTRVNGINLPDRYEDLPEGWVRTGDHRDLCPDCARKFEQTMKSFYGDRR
jgi:hypothetical protein